MVANKRSTVLTQEQGRQHAAKMFHEIGAWWGADLPKDVRDEDIGKYMRLRDPAILRRYIATAQQSGGEFEQGFMWALSDYIGMTLNAGIPDIEVAYGSKAVRHG